MVKSAKTTQEMCSKCCDVFSGIMCFKGKFSLQLKDGVKPHQATPSCMAYALQEQLKKEIERSQYQQIIIVSLGVSSSAEWCKSFIILPRSNDMIDLCLEPAQLS